MRLSIVKRHHQQLLMEIASSLRSDDPKDALEHILNCWVNPCTPFAQVVAANEPLSGSLAGDDLDAIASWD